MKEKPRWGLSLFVFGVCVVGASGLIAQVLLLRELLVSFYGNELTMGVILANWIVSEALGVFLIGRLIDRVKNPFNIFVCLQAAFSLVLPVSVYGSRVFKAAAGIPTGEGIGLPAAFLASFIILLPVGFCHGGMFSSVSKIYSSRVQEAASSMGKVYAWETLGTLLGGIAATYALIPRFDSFHIAVFLGALSLIICLLFFKEAARPFRVTVILLLLFTGLFILNKGPQALQELSIAQQWRQGRVLDYRNSIFGNIVVTKQLEQYTFYYNGLPVITAPHPDKQFMEDFVHLPLLSHPAPKRILVVSGGAGGMIREILKHSVDRVDYLEIDPLLIRMLKDHPTALIASELNDPRVRVINEDGRFFLRSRRDTYDLILIGLSNPSDLSTNRFFTKEFFSLAQSRLSSGGILTFWLPGSLAHISEDLGNLNACIWRAAQSVFPYHRVIPGDYNIYLVSNKKDNVDIPSGVISERLSERGINSEILVPGYIEYRLSQQWQDWFTPFLSASPVKINRDLRPVAVFQALKLWNKKFSAGTNRYLDILSSLTPLKALFLVLLVFVSFSYRTILRRRKNAALVYAIATTGFFGMLSSLILIFSFQVFYGYVYQWIGLLMGLFMGGTALGGMLMVKIMKRAKEERRLFMRCELLIVLFSLAMGLFLSRTQLYAMNTLFIFMALFFAAGCFLGLEFPLAAKIYLGIRQEAGLATAVLYGADLCGGWLAGVLGGILLIPLWGVFNSCLFMVFIKLSSLLLLRLSI